MDYRWIYYFIKLSECNSITQAAKELYISQQALSKAIQKLEAEYNTRLFYRTNQGIQLTKEGKYLKGKFKHICHNYEEALTESYSHFNIQKGSLQFGVCPGFFRSVPARYLMDFSNTYPRITIEQIETADLDCENYVKADSHHFALCTKPWHMQGLQFLSLYSEPIYFIASKDHPLSGRSEIALSDLANEKFLFFNNRYNIHYRTIHACKLAGFTPNIIYRSADASQLVKLTSQNLGVFLCVKHVYDETNKEDLICLPLVDSYLDWELGIVFRNYEKLDKNAKLFINYFISKFQ